MRAAIVLVVAEMSAPERRVPPPLAQSPFFFLITGSGDAGGGTTLLIELITSIVDAADTYSSSDAVLEIKEMFFFCFLYKKSFICIQLFVGMFIIYLYIYIYVTCSRLEQKLSKISKI
jgi:hypothetical protein